MAFKPDYWKNGESGGTPITAAELNRIEQAGAAKAQRGPEGPAGDAASVSVGTTSTLDAGVDATVVNSGTDSAAVLDFGIPKGAEGPQGPQGPKGDDGARGPKGDPGTDGSDGADGVSVTGATSDGTNITFTLSDGSSFDVPWPAQ